METMGKNVFNGTAPEITGWCFSVEGNFGFCLLEKGQGYC